MDETGFQAKDFLEFCNSLLNLIQSIDEEPTYRTIVNRCYLAAYVTAKTILVSRGCHYTNDYTDYHNVERDLRIEYENDGRFLQDSLSTLREARGEADYDYPFHGFLDRRFVDHKIHLAKRIISKL